MRAAAVFLLVLGHLALCQGWTCTQGPPLSMALQVDSGLGQVVAIDANNHAYFLSGSSWIRLLDADLKHISVGEAGIWGTGVSDFIYKYVDGSWAQVHGALIQVDAGGNDFAGGVNVGNDIYCLKPNYTMTFNGRGSAVQWVKISGGLKYVSCGPYGCWGVNSEDHIYFNLLKSADNCSFSDWELIDGGLSMIEVGSDGLVFGVNQIGDVYERTGISKGVPKGNGWKQLTFSVTMKHVSYDLGTIYGVTTGGVIMKCTACTA